MRLIQVLIIVLTELSVGTLLFSSLLPAREIRVSFFGLSSLSGALTAALALALTKFGLGSAWWDVRYLGLTVIAATVAFGFFRLERPAGGRLFLILSGLLGLVFGLLPLSGRTLALRHLDTTAPFYFDASFLAGAALLGANTAGLILAHGYLVVRRLSPDHLERFAKVLLGAIGLRAAVLTGTIVTLTTVDPKLGPGFISELLSVEGDAFFFALRILFGIGVPLLLAFLILRSVRESPYPSLIRRFYLCECSVLLGELMAARLLI
jgi:hypothetical protein